MMSTERNFDESYIFGTDEVWKVKSGFTVPLQIPMTTNKMKVFEAAFQSLVRYKGFKTRPEVLRRLFQDVCNYANDRKPLNSMFTDETFFSGRFSHPTLKVMLTERMREEFIASAKILAGPTLEDMERLVRSRLKILCFHANRAAMKDWMWDPMHKDDQFDGEGNYLNDPRASIDR